MNTEIRIAQALIWKDAESIIHVKFDDKARLDMADAKSVFSAIVQLGSGLDHKLVITDTRGIRGFEKGFRDYFDEKPMEDFVDATAALVASPLSKTFVNLYLKLKKPNYPVRLFIHEKEARDWLDSFKMSNNSVL